MSHGRPQESPASWPFASSRSPPHLDPGALPHLRTRAERLPALTVRRWGPGLAPSSRPGPAPTDHTQPPQAQVLFCAQRPSQSPSWKVSGRLRWHIRRFGECGLSWGCDSAARALEAQAPPHLRVKLRLHLAAAGVLRHRCVLWTPRGGLGDAVGGPPCCSPYVRPTCSVRLRRRLRLR